MDPSQLAALTKPQLIELVGELNRRLEEMESQQQLENGNGHARQLTEEMLFSDRLLETGPSQILNCRLEGCPECGTQEITQTLIQTYQLAEMMPIQVGVLKVRRYAVSCRHCGHTTPAAAPPGFEPGNLYGPRLDALVRMLKAD